MANNCYIFEKIIYDDPIFTQVEATYIIHLEGNGRIESIISQLKKYHPTRIVYILYNKGFKKCKKDPYINKTTLDLVDAFLYVFNDAYKKGYNNILVLEDDFIFDEIILENNYHAKEIEYFIESKKNDSFVYYLGTLPIIQTSSYSNSNLVLLSTGTHACIYPKKIIENTLLKFEKSTIHDWDCYLNFNYRRYKYNKILVYQLFPQTENQKNWGDHNIIYKIISKYFTLLNTKINLDKNIYPGYVIYNIFSKIFFWFLLFSIILLFILLYFFVKKNYKWIKKHKQYFLFMIIFIFLLYILLYIIFILTFYVFLIFILYNLYKK